MKPVSPVIAGLEPYEVTYGGAEAGQPEYMPLPSLRSPDGQVMARWQPTPEERLLIASGSDLLITLGCNGQYPPTKVRVTTDVDQPEYVKAELRLDDALALRVLSEDVHKANQAFQTKLAEVFKSETKGSQ